MKLNLKFNIYTFAFALILALAFGLRAYGNSWDNGTHMHPDERMIMIVAGRLDFPLNFDPDFFNYGSLPIYLLRGISEALSTITDKNLATYDDMLIIGRWISTITDCVTLILVFLIASKISKNKIFPLFAAFIYCISFFPIQNSNFFVVDVYLTFFVTLLVYILINFFLTNKDRDPSILLKVALTGMIFGCMLATKASSLIFIPATLLPIFYYVLKQNEKNTLKISQSIIYTLTLLFFGVSTFFLTMPYAVIKWTRFYTDVTNQTRMNSDPYTFPFTLQYVGSTQYIYYAKNILIYGMGPILTILAVSGIIVFLLKLYKLSKKEINNFELKYFKILVVKILADKNILIMLFLLAFYGIYFAILGRSAVKFMRYMLPLYPFLSIMAGYALYKLYSTNYFKLKFNNRLLIVSSLMLFSLVWTLSFLNIYTKENTRIQADQWILANIPKGSALGVEHWDDRLPLNHSEQYNIVEFPLYEFDTFEKWEMMSQKIESVDYIIIASNRLHVPLTFLGNCNGKHKRCYDTTAKYYRDLFSGELGFSKVAEFESKPNLFGIGFSDQSADESFTVYDHPKIMIFKKR